MSGEASGSRLIIFCHVRMPNAVSHMTGSTHADVVATFESRRLRLTRVARQRHVDRPGTTSAHANGVGLRCGYVATSKNGLPRPAGHWSNYSFQRLIRAGDRTRTGDVQLGKEAEE